MTDQEAGSGAEAARRDAVRCLLEARRVALVGATPRPGSLGERLLIELKRSPSRPQVELVNPRHTTVAGHRCLPSLAAVQGTVDLVALAVGDTALESELAVAAERGDRAALIFASAFDAAPGSVGAAGTLRERLAATAAAAGMAVCGAGCMGFVNSSFGLRAVGYLEPHPLPSGPIALVTHSGSAFSALLRADRRLGWTLAVSSGQELVTTTADYLDYALDAPDTRVVALLLETLRRPEALLTSLRRAATADIPVVALTVGSSPGGRAMVQAHSGALAGDDATWEALAGATGVIRVRDLAELVDTLELFAAGRRPPPVAPARDKASPRGGIATVHDSGAERALAVDVAASTGTVFAAISDGTRRHLEAVLDGGLDATNPLDVWGTGARAREVLAGSLLALAEDPSVQAVGLCVDLVPELDGDTSYEEAVLDAWKSTTTPLCVLTNLPSALDRAAARRLRDAGVPVLEGTASGLAALRHLREHAERLGRLGVAPPKLDDVRRARWRSRLLGAPLTTIEAIALLAAYGIPSPATVAVADAVSLAAAADAVGWPLVLKTDAGVAHKSDVGGVVLAIAGQDQLAAAYDEMAGRLGREALVAATAPDGVELALGVVRDPLLGSLVVVGAGGTLVEVIADRQVALPPLDRAAALALLDRLEVRPVLDGQRGRPASDLGAVADAVVAVATLALELGDLLDALEVNPLRCGPDGVLALDVLVEPRPVAGE